MPLSAIEQLTMGQLAHEIAILLADLVVSEAKRIAAAPGDRVRLHAKREPDWIDSLIIERMALDVEQPRGR